MKRVKFVLMSFILIPTLFGCGGNKTAKVITNGKYCTFENKTKTALNSDFTIAVTPYNGYELSSSCFNVKVKNTDITSKTNCWTFSNNSLSIKKEYVIGDINIVANANKIVRDYNVTVNANSYISAYDTFPKTCVSNKDLIIKFKTSSTNIGVDCSVKINNVDYYDYQMRSESDYSYVKISSDAIVGDIVINLNGVNGKISLSQSEACIHSYDTQTIFYYSPLGGNITVTPASSSIEAFNYTVDTSNNSIVIDSTNNKTCSDIELTVSSDSASSVSNKIKVSVYHPTNVQEALDAVTLGFIRGNTEFDVTFDYTNNESFSDFADHLEITENMYYSSKSGLVANYYTGAGKTNSFALQYLAAHGREYADDKSYVESKLYRPLNCANTVIAENECSGKTSTLAIENSSKTIKVFNSEELFWAVEHGYLPTFDSGTFGQNAKKIYELAKAAVIANTYDEMPLVNKLINLFNYLENIVSYDYNAATSSAGYPEWLKYPAYFLDGVFLNEGIAVCDGFSKAYALLCGLDCLPVIRSFGYSNAGGHAWNYANIEDHWYLICPTWAKGNFPATDQFGKQFSIFTYDSFAKASSYFYDKGGDDYLFSDLAFPLISKSNTYYKINPLEKTTFLESLSTHNFIISSQADLTSILKKCKDLGLGNTRFYIFADTSNYTSNILTLIKNSIISSGFSCTVYGYYCINNNQSQTLLLFN